jgi:hypothetical protein
MDSKTLTSVIVLAIIVFILVLFLPLTSGVAYITFWKGRDNTNSTVYTGGYKKKK